jgi:hypothetical protein
MNIMTHKEKTLKAWKELEEKYLNPSGRVFFNARECPLCKIHDVWSGCLSCPLTGVVRRVGGCLDFTTYKNAFVCHCQGVYILKNGKPSKAFRDRAEFFRKTYPILEKIPAKRFTPTGWTYFKELDRNW